MVQVRSTTIGGKIENNKWLKTMFVYVGLQQLFPAKYTQNYVFFLLVPILCQNDQPNPAVLSLFF
jgi:hypothetical protein